MFEIQNWKDYFYIWELLSPNVPVLTACRDCLRRNIEIEEAVF